MFDFFIYLFGIIIIEKEIPAISGFSTVLVRS